MSTDDKELLKLAAKAVGFQIIWDGEACFRLGSYESWNPLLDDGDAFRLVIVLKKLGLWGPVVIGQSLTGWYDNPYAAARRAVVMGAAALGMEMR